MSENNNYRPYIVNFFASWRDYENIPELINTGAMASTPKAYGEHRMGVKRN